jgi:hypothetical protein
MARVEAVFPTFVTSIEYTLNGNIMVETTQNPQQGGNFYAKAMIIPKQLSKDEFVASEQYISTDMKNQYYYKSVMPDSQRFFNPSAPFCSDLWTPQEIQVSNGQTYGLVDDPSQDFSRAENVKIQRIKNCNPSRGCAGCYSTQKTKSTDWVYLAFTITSDNARRTLFAFGVCKGWIQIECTSMTTCGNGYYSDNFLAKDPVTFLTLNPVTCMPCEPGTWNTCRTEKTSCSW